MVTAYAVVAWLILQVGVIVAEPLALPDWTVRALIIAAIVGFPVSFVLAWVIDIRPEGLIFDLPLLAGTGNERKSKKTDWIFASMLVVVLIGGAYYLITMLLNELSTPDSTHLESANHGSASPNSIAVLAFENFGGDEGTGYFAAGLAEEILLLLSRLEELKVASRTSSFQFRDHQIDIREVASRLGVALILEGSAREYNQRVRVAAQLVDGSNGFNRWGATFERSVDDIFAIQQEIASNIVQQLELVISRGSQQQLQSRATESNEAYLLYLQGVGRLRSSNDADVMQAAARFFDQAISLDNEFAKAYAGKCEALLRLYQIGNRVGDFDTAEQACNQANELANGSSSEVSLALGKLYMQRGWVERAEQHLKTAMGVASDPTDSYIQLGELMAAQGRHGEAEQFLKTALASNQHYWAAQEALASYYYRSKRYREAIDAYEKATLLAPNVATVFGGKGANYWMLGEFDQAIAAYEESLRIKPSRLTYTNIGSLHYYAGRFEQAVENQKKALVFAPDDHRIWGRLAEALLFAGQQDEATAAYQKAAELAEQNLTVNERDWKTASLLGIYYAHLLRNDEARELSALGVELSGGDPESLYLQALVYVQLGNSELALEFLESAVSQNEQFSLFIKADPFLQTLQERPRFKALLQTD